MPPSSNWRSIFCTYDPAHAEYGHLLIDRHFHPIQEMSVVLLQIKQNRDCDIKACNEALVLLCNTKFNEFRLY